MLLAVERREILRRRAQQPVARGVAEGVVRSLESVDIRHDEYRARLRRRRAVGGLLQVGVVVADARERIGEAELLEPVGLRLLVVDAVVAVVEAVVDGLHHIGAGTVAARGAVDVARGLVVFVHALVDGVRLLRRRLPVLALCRAILIRPQIVGELEPRVARLEELAPLPGRELPAPRPLMVQVFAAAAAAHERIVRLIVLVAALLRRRALEAAVPAVQHVDEREGHLARRDSFRVALEPLIRRALARDGAHELLIAEEPVEIRREPVGRRIVEAEPVAHLLLRRLLAEAAGAQVFHQRADRDVVRHALALLVAPFLERLADARADVGELVLNPQMPARVDGHAHHRTLDRHEGGNELRMEMLDVGDDDRAARGDHARAPMAPQILQLRPGADVRAERHGQDVAHAHLPQRAEDVPVDIGILRGDHGRDEHGDLLPVRERAEELLRIIDIAARAVRADGKARAAGRAAQRIDTDMRLALVHLRNTGPHRKTYADAFIAADTIFVGVNKTFVF